MEKYIDTESWEDSYSISTSVIKRVSNYTGLNFKEVLELPYSFFMLLNKDSWIDSWGRNSEGREFLKNLWRLQQTGADLDKVREYEHGREVEKWQEK